MMIYYPVCKTVVSNSGDSTDGTSVPIITDHNSLNGLQGGDSNNSEYYHLSLDEYQNIQSQVISTQRIFRGRAADGRYLSCKYPMFAGRDNEFIDVYLPDEDRFLNKGDFNLESRNCLGERTFSNYNSGLPLSDTIYLHQSYSRDVIVYYKEVEINFRPTFVFTRNRGKPNMRTFKRIMNINNTQYYITDIYYDDSNITYTLKYEDAQGQMNIAIEKFLPEFVTVNGYHF